MSRFDEQDSRATEQEATDEGDDRSWGTRQAHHGVFGEGGEGDGSTARAVCILGPLCE